MQHDDQAMFVTQCTQRSIQPHYVISLFRVADGVEVSGQGFEAFSGQLVFGHSDQPLPRNANGKIVKATLREQV